MLRDVFADEIMAVFVNVRVEYQEDNCRKSTLHLASMLNVFIVDGVDIWRHVLDLVVFDGLVVVSDVGHAKPPRTFDLSDPGSVDMIFLLLDSCGGVRIN